MDESGLTCLIRTRVLVHAAGKIDAPMNREIHACFL